MFYLLRIFRSLVRPRPFWRSSGGGRRPLKLDEPVVVAAVCVPDDVVEDNEALELELELPGVQRCKTF